MENELLDFAKMVLGLSGIKTEKCENGIYLRLQGKSYVFKTEKEALEFIKHHPMFAQEDK